MHDEINVARVVVEVEHELAFSVAPTNGASRMDFGLLRRQVLEERNSGESHRQLLHERAAHGQTLSKSDSGDKQRGAVSGLDPEPFRSLLKRWRRDVRRRTAL